MNSSTFANSSSQSVHGLSLLPRLQVLLAHAFSRIIVSAQAFHNAEWMVSTLVHGDDFFSIGTSGQLDKLELTSAQREAVRRCSKSQVALIARLVRVIEGGEPGEGGEGEGEDGQGELLLKMTSLLQLNSKM